jgi:hypothetical protein
MAERERELTGSIREIKQKYSHQNNIHQQGSQYTGTLQHEIQQNDMAEREGGRENERGIERERERERELKTQGSKQLA